MIRYATIGGMSAAAVEKSPLKLNIPEEAGKPLPISSETAVLSAKITESMADGKLPDKASVHGLVSSIASDLKSDGVALSEKDIQKASQEVSSSLSSDRTPVDAVDMKPDVPDLENIDIGAYTKTLDTVMKTYGLSKGQWGTITGLLSGNEVIATMLGGAQTRELATPERYEKLLRKLDLASRQAKLQDTPVKDVKKWFQELPGTRKKKAIGLLVDATWPVWSMGVQKLGEAMISNTANKLYFKERAKLQDMVNTRVGSSLLMRDFSFFHDRSAGTMLQIINKGKEATVDLVASTYFDLVPMMFRVASYPFGQAFLGRFAAMAAAIKIPIVGAAGYLGIKEQQQQHANELKAWDKINTELVTTLTNLETVRTAGKPEEEAAMLKGVLADRDFVAEGGLIKQKSRERTLGYLFDVLDVGVPVGKQLKGLWNEVHSDTGLKLMDFAGAGWQIYQRAGYAKSEQVVMRQAAQSILQTYVQRIIPDIQDIQRMEELLGPYDALDTPTGPKEQKRVGADTLASYDISVQNVGYKNILHDVSIDIPQGSFTAIKGPSGLGKTTLLRHLVGLYEPDSGSITIGDKPLDQIKKYGDQSLLNHIGYAGQSSELLEGWTLRENLLLGTTNVQPERLTNVMHDLGLDHLTDRLDSTVKHYSGGEKRRLGIARALLKDPKILILDEPTANLDAKSTQQVLDIIKDLRLKKPDMTVLAITHDPTFEKVAERLIDFSMVNIKPVAESTGVPALNDHQVLEAIAKPN